MHRQQGESAAEIKRKQIVDLPPFVRSLFHSDEAARYGKGPKVRHIPEGWKMDESYTKAIFGIGCESRWIRLECQSSRYLCLCIGITWLAASVMMLASVNHRKSCSPIPNFVANRCDQTTLAILLKLTTSQRRA